MSSTTDGQQQQQNNIFTQIDQAKKEAQLYIKLQPGVKQVLQFNMSKITIVDTEYDGKKTGGKQVKYMVIDPMFPTVEKELKVNVTKCDPINALLKKNIFLMEITKMGTDKQYQIMATPV